jgi:hypothetical protein
VKFLVQRPFNSARSGQGFEPEIVISRGLDEAEGQLEDHNGLQVFGASKPSGAGTVLIEIRSGALAPTTKAD